MMSFRSIPTVGVFMSCSTLDEDCDGDICSVLRGRKRRARVPRCGFHMIGYVSVIKCLMHDLSLLVQYVAFQAPADQSIVALVLFCLDS